MLPIVDTAKIQRHLQDVAGALLASTTAKMPRLAEHGDVVTSAMAAPVTIDLQQSIEPQRVVA